MKRFKGVKISGVIKDSFEKKYQMKREIHHVQYIKLWERFKCIKMSQKFKDSGYQKYQNDEKIHNT